MSQITKDFALTMIDQCARGGRPALTIWELEQLARAWLRLAEASVKVNNVAECLANHMNREDCIKELRLLAAVMGYDAARAADSAGVLSLVVAERKRQDERWGPAHDDEHTTADFVRFIEHYAGLARDAEIQADPDEARKRLVQVAALAVAAAESIERKFLRCPAPLMGDDGTVADCIAKGHCGCDAKPLAPSGGSEAGISAHTGATRAADSAEVAR